MRFNTITAPFVRITNRRYVTKVHWSSTSRSSTVAPRGAPANMLSQLSCNLPDAISWELATTSRHLHTFSRSKAILMHRVDGTESGLLKYVLLKDGAHGDHDDEATKHPLKAATLVRLLQPQDNLPNRVPSPRKVHLRQCSVSGSCAASTDIIPCYVTLATSLISGLARGSHANLSLFYIPDMYRLDAPRCCISPWPLSAVHGINSLAVWTAYRKDTSSQTLHNGRVYPGLVDCAMCGQYAHCALE
jgi:hypothetical protein